MKNWSLKWYLLNPYPAGTESDYPAWFCSVDSLSFSFHRDIPKMIMDSSKMEVGLFHITNSTG